MFQRAATWLILSLMLPAVLPAAGIPILGRVLGPDGEPRSKAEVRLEPIPPTYERARLRLAGQPGPEPVARTRSAADGTFELAAPRPGMWKVVVAVRGALTMERRLIPLVAEAVLPPVELRPAADLEVRLRDAEGEPRPGAVGAYTLGLRGDAWRPQLRLAAAGEDGVARLPLGREEKIQLEVLAEGHPMVAYEVFDESSVTIDLADGVAGTVRAIDRQNRPLAGAVAFQGSALLPFGLTDDDGHLSLVLRPKDNPALQVATAERWHGSFEPDLAAAGGETKDLRLEPPATFHGRVLDLTSQDPVSDALVWAVRGEFVETDRQGRYALDVGVYKSRWLQASAAGYQAGRSRVESAAGGDAPAIALAPASSISGKVLDSEGGLLDGVAIKLRILPQSGRLSVAHRSRMGQGWSGRTTSRGIFRVAGVPSGVMFELTFEAAGLAPQTLEIEPLEPFENRSDIEVVMRPGRVAVGRVVDEADVPVAGAAVRLESPPPTADLMTAMRMMHARDDGEDEPTHLTDAEGRFEIADLAVGRYDLQVRASGFAPAKVPGVRVTESGDEVDFGTVVLVPGATIDGRVSDSSGAAIAAAEITLGLENQGFMPVGPPDSQPRTTTDAKGRFSLGDLLPGQPVSVTVSKKGYGSETRSSVKPPTEEPLTFVLEPAGRLSGRVVDERGAPIRGAMVNVQQDRRVRAVSMTVSRSRPGWARTDAEGSFSIEDVDAGKLQVTAAAESYQQKRLDVEMAAGQAIEVELVLVPGAVIEGAVTTADGAPVAEAQIIVTQQQSELFGGDSISANGRSDVEGRYRVTGAPTGPATIIVYREGRQGLRKAVEVRPGTNIVDLVLAPGFEVSGQVVAPDGEPVGGAAVTIHQATQPGMAHFSRGSPRELSAADGSFTLSDVEAGKYAVSASLEGFAPARSEAFEVAGDVSGLLLELRRGATLRGRVLGLEFDELGSLAIMAYSQQGGMRRGLVDYSAEFVFDNLAPGQWHVQAQVAGSGRSSTMQVEVPEGVSEVEKDIEFGTGYTLTGIVLDGGQPLAAAQVTASDSVSSLGHGSTGADGRFRIENLKAGSYRVMVMSGAGFQHMETIELVGDHELRIELATGAVSGTVRSAADGEPLAGATVTLEPLAAGDGAFWARQFSFGNRAETDSSGRFQIPRVRHGSWRVRANMAGHAPGEATVTIADRGAVQVDLRLTPTEGVAFAVALQSGADLPLVQVAILDASGRRIGNSSHPVIEGRVQVSTVPPGRWELVVQGSDSANTRFVVDSPGDQGSLILPTGGTLSVRVPDLDRVPMAGVTLRGPDGKPMVSIDGLYLRPGEWLMSGGQAIVPGLVPGNWSFTVRHEDGRTWSGSALVTAGETTEVSLP